MLKIEFPSDNKVLAAAIGRALMSYGGGDAVFSGTTTYKMNKTADIYSFQNKGDSEENMAADLNEREEPVPSGGAEQNVANSQPTNTDVRQDEKGVQFDPKYCGNAADPYYKTGKKAGQWKKKAGSVTEDEYDSWYAANLPADTGRQEQKQEQHIDTGSAFGGDDSTGQTDSLADPSNGGELMVWVSEMQTAKHLTQSDVTEAYKVTGLTASDIFVGDNAAAAVARLYDILSSKVPA